jgi:tetratricopeptide (TPR) repeat protein
MDPMTAPATSSNPVEDRPAGVSLRQLWQVPLFFTGIVALITACLTRGVVGPDPARSVRHHLVEARRLLHHRSGDPEAALRHAQQAVDNLMAAPERAAEAFFLLGSAHVRVGESSEESAAKEHWSEARRYLEEAERRGLLGDDAGRLHYRLAKVSFYTKDDPWRVIALLKANKDFADDRAEAYTLLVQAYLRLNPPNLKEALAANEELRQKVPQVGEEVLGPAKLVGARILLRLNRTEDARKTLEKISDPAPPAVLIEARMLLAGLYQEDRKWSEAAELWKAVRAEKRVPLAEADVGGVLYNLGVCCRRLDQSSQAAEAWSECLRRTHGAEAQAAALALAELRLREANPEKAVDMLAEGVAKVRVADDWKNALMELPRVRELFEDAIKTYRQAGRFDLAVQTAVLYERVAIVPKAQIARADLSAAWARHKQEQARKVNDPAARKKDEATARELFRQAAEAHTEAAKLLTNKADKDEHLWLSAVCSQEGQDYARAAEKLKKIVEQADSDNVERLSEGWYLLGEAYRNLPDQDAADAARGAYLKCIEQCARFTCRARYQLALLDIEAGKIDAATHNLEQNLKLEHRDPDPEAQQKSRYALCSLLYHGGAKLTQNYRRVVMYLEGKLDGAAVTPEAVRARYQLADSYRQLADQRTVNRYMSEKMSLDAHNHYLDENRRALTRAAEEFGKLEELLGDPEMCSLLTVKQRVEVPFIVAECSYFLGQYEKALNKYEALAKKWPNRPEGLWALGETVRCYGSMGNYEKLRQRVEEIRAVLPTVAGLSDADKQFWNDWLAQVKRIPAPLKDRGPEREHLIINNPHNSAPTAEDH